MAKVVIQFEMEGTVRDELVAAICSIRGYQPTIKVNGETVANPETPGQFAMKEFVQHGQNLIAQKRYEDAKAAAAAAAKAALEAEILAEGVVTATAQDIEE